MSKILIDGIRFSDLIALMNATRDERRPVLDLPLSEIPERTKDFLLAVSATGKSPVEAIQEVLDEAAAKAGFAPEPKAA